MNEEVDMALRKCKECGKEISTKAESCPNCGAKVKKKMGCLQSILLIFIVLIAIGYFSSKSDYAPSSSPTKSTSSPSSKKSKEIKTYQLEETVNIGYTSYAVWKAWWSAKLSDNEFLDDKPDAMFLFVKLTVRNDDKKARSIAPFKLIDENGAEYETSSKAWSVDDSIGVLESLNPGVQKDGVIVFDVPQTHKYKMKVSGGYWSTDEALIDLNL